MYAAAQHVEDRRPVADAAEAAVGAAARAEARHRAEPSPRLRLPAVAAPVAGWWLGAKDVRPTGCAPMTARKLRQIHIQGINSQGRTFRPSDWAERLAGAMSCFRPGGGVGGISAAIGYSPLCFPRVVDGVKCVIVSEALREVEPMAWDFVLSFARDNDLKVVDAAPPGDAAEGPAPAA